MPFDLLAPLTAIQGKLTASPALVDNVVIGSPAALTYQLTASLTLAAGVVAPEDFDDLAAHQQYLVEFGYDTGGDVEAAERAILAAVPGLQDRIAQDPTLGGVVADTSVNWRGASAPEYIAVSGSEARRFPVIVDCTLRERNPQ